MKILIKIGKKQISLFLEKNGDSLDKIVFDLDNDLSQNLLVEIDKLLKKNKLVPGDIEDIRLTAKIKESYTSYRIAKIIKDTFLWSVKRES